MRSITRTTQYKVTIMIDKSALKKYVINQNQLTQVKKRINHTLQYYKIMIEVNQIKKN